MIEIPCLRENYGGLRGQPVRYLVVHYTAGRNDRAVDNGAYFARAQVGASAHYFVDGQTVVRSVPEEAVAWHCGGSLYRHPECRNGNSIGVEICSRWEDGQYRFDPAALERAKGLLRQLMARYGIPADRVLRHYDVTGKCCPAPFVGRGQRDWEAFKGGLSMYDTVEQVPVWGRGTVEKLTDRGVLTGDGGGLGLSYELVRILVILDRAGIFDNEEETTCLMH